jgi:hypothetical protein
MNFDEIESRYNDAYFKSVHCSEAEKAKALTKLVYWRHRYFTECTFVPRGTK